MEQWTRYEFMKIGEPRISPRLCVPKSYHSLLEGDSVLFCSSLIDYVQTDFYVSLENLPRDWTLLHDNVEWDFKTETLRLCWNEKCLEYSLANKVIVLRGHSFNYLKIAQIGYQKVMNAVKKGDNSISFTWDDLYKDHAHTMTYDFGMLEKLINDLLVAENIEITLEGKDNGSHVNIHRKSLPVS